LPKEIIPGGGNEAAGIQREAMQATAGDRQPIGFDWNKVCLS
jgi:hypothetical protein